MCLYRTTLIAMNIDKNFFIYYRDDECCLKIFETSTKGFEGFLVESDYDDRFNQLMNLPITMKKIYVNVLASDFLVSKLDKYKKHFENLPFLLEELNITVYIPKDKIYLNSKISLDIKKKFDIFLCQIEKLPFGCTANITYLSL